MAIDQGPQIVVLKVWSEYKRIPGQAEPVEEIWVRYAPRHSAQSTTNDMPVRRLEPPEGEIKNDEMGIKAGFFKARWAQIKPYVDAYIAKEAPPEYGTAFGAWAGITAAQADALKAAGIKCVEDLANAPDSSFQKVLLPNLRQLRIDAKAFLDAKGLVNVQDELAKRDRMNEEMAAQLAELQEKLAALSAGSDEEEAAPKARRGRPPKAEAA